MASTSTTPTSSTSTPLSTVTATVASEITTTAAPTTTTVPSPEYESTLPHGMSCADFATIDLGWHSAIGYWFVNGRPASLDNDDDGFPCEHIEFPLSGETCCGEEPVYSWVPGDPSIDEWHVPGMLCRELAVDRQYPGYVSALVYWLLEGEPSRMDADGDGIPCETVWPEAFIRDVLEDPWLLTVHPWNMTTSELPTGMRCREAIFWRPFYPQVLGYYFAEGLPARMDADSDGIPCETVYHDAHTYGHWILENTQPNLSCSELSDLTRDYQFVVEYYLAHGQPQHLDADGDGYPCSPEWTDDWSEQYFKEGMPGCCAG